MDLVGIAWEDVVGSCMSCSGGRILSCAYMYCLQVKSNLVTPRNGEPLIAAIQDFITGGYCTRVQVYL